MVCIIMISTYNITTGMGECFGTLSFLNNEEMIVFNTIGYSGKDLDGKKISREEYLNKLNKGQFKMDQTKWDNGNFEEKFTIIRVH